MAQDQEYAVAYKEAIIGPFADEAEAGEYVRGEEASGGGGEHAILPLVHPSESPVQPEGRW